MCVDVYYALSLPMCVCVCLQNQLKVKIDSYKQAQSNISSRETKYVELRIHYCNIHTLWSVDTVYGNALYCVCVSG